MTKLFKKAAAGLLSAALIVTTLSACGGNTGPGTTSSAASGEETSSTAESGESTASTAASGDSTVLTWYYPDDLNNHTDIVWEAINKYTKEKINVTIEPHPIPWGEYDDKINTITNSGQDFDIMFRSAAYFTAVATGAAQPIEQYLDTVGKDVKAALPESLWKAATVDGHIYGIPTQKDNASCPGIIYNKTMADDLGITMPETFGGLYELDDLLHEIKAKKDEKYPEDANIPLLKAYNYVRTTHDTLCGDLVVTNIKGIDSYQSRQEGEAFVSFAEPETLEWFKLMKKWVDDGIVPMDAPNYDTESNIKNSGKLFMEHSLGYVSFPKDGWSKDFETAFIPSSWKFMSTEYAMFGSNIIGAKSKNPEKAVEFLNLVNTDNYVANTIRFGIEGDYYTKTEDNRLDFTSGLNSDPANRAYYKWYGWQFGNLFAMSLPAQEDSNLWKDLEKANNEAFISDNMGFVFDRSSLLNEITACTAVQTEYLDNLKNGMAGDVEKSLEDFNAKLKASGIDKIVAECQKQLSAWRAENGLKVFEG